MQINRLLLIILLIPLIAGCGAVSHDVRTIIITPSSATLLIGATQQFTATGKDEMGNYVTFTPSWEVVDTSVGTISATGLFYAIASGETTVEVSTGTIIASVTVEVVTGALDSITVSPDPVTLIAGQVQQFTAKGWNTTGGELTITPSWELVGAIGTIDAFTGLFTAEVAGSGTVKATYMGVTGESVVSVIPFLVSIEVSPNPANLINGQKQQFTAVGKNSSDETVTIYPVWSVTGTIGTIGASTGYFTAEVSGSGTVKATYLGVTGESIVNVTPVLITLEVIANSCTYVSSTDGGTNYGSAEPCYVGINSSTGARYRSYLKFDVSSIPSGVTAESATLRFRVEDNSGTVAVQIKAVIQAWNESTITYNSQPSTSEPIVLSDSISGTDFKTISNDSLRNLVRNWRSGSLTNNGLVMHIDDLDTTAEYFKFTGRGVVVADNANKPTLIINYLY